MNGVFADAVAVAEDAAAEEPDGADDKAEEIGEGPEVTDFTVFGTSSNAVAEEDVEDGKGGTALAAEIINVFLEAFTLASFNWTSIQNVSYDKGIGVHRFDDPMSVKSGVIDQFT